MRRGQWWSSHVLGIQEQWHRTDSTKTKIISGNADMITNPINEHTYNGISLWFFLLIDTRGSQCKSKYNFFRLSMVDGHPIYSKFHPKFESTKYTDRWTWSESQHLIIIFLDALHCSVLRHCLHCIVFDRRWFSYIHPPSFTQMFPSLKCSQIMKVRGMWKAKAAENGPKGKIPCFSWPGVEAKNLWVDEWSLKCCRNLKHIFRFSLSSHLHILLCKWSVKSYFHI